MDDIEIIDDEPKEKKKKNKKKNHKLLIVLLIILFIVLGMVGYFFYMRYQAELLRKEEDRINGIISDIKSHYSESVIVINDTDLYMSNSIIGSIHKGSIIELNDINIDSNTKYFNIKDLNYDISYKDVGLIDSTISVINSFSKENRYNNYIPFNKNVVTKENYSLYYNGEIVYTFKDSDNYPIIINNYDGYYYVEFNNKLYGIKSDDIEKIIDSNNSSKKNIGTITTLCYHRVNMENKCTDSSICIKQNSFDQQMKYLKDNSILTLTMEEMYMYINGFVQLPKSVLITLDDGWGLEGAIKVFEKYGLHGISFAPTYRIEDNSFTIDTFKSDSIEVQSHTHNMHRNYVCSKSLSSIGSSSQGGAILCESEDYIKSDLKKSIELIENLGKNKVIGLAYPFYDYNDRAIKLLKESGFKMGFGGTFSTNGKSKVGTDPYKVPRRTIFDTTSFNTWKGYL